MPEGDTMAGWKGALRGGALPHLSVALKMTVVFSALLAIIAVVGSVLYLNMQSVKAAQDSSLRADRILTASAGARFALARQENSLRGYILSDEPYYLSRIERLHRPQFMARMETLRALAEGDARLEAQIASAMRRFIRWEDQALAPAALLAGGGDLAGARSMVGRDGLADRLIDPAEAALDLIEAEAAVVVARETRKAETALARMEAALTAGLLAIAAAAGLLGLLLTRDMARPITELTRVMKALALGRVDQLPPALNRRDEVGEMARAVETFRRAAIVKQRLEAEAEESRRRTEALMIEAQAANRAKSEFLAVMTHELRTPLNGVLGMAQVLAGEPLTPGQRQQLAVIEQSGQELLNVISDVLDVSRIEAGRLSLQPGPFDMGALLDGLEAIHRRTAAERRLRLDFIVGPGVRDRFVADEVRLRQVIGALISNALKFTDAGWVRVEARMQDGQLSVHVSDTGPGVPEALQPHLFNRFFQADGSSTRRHGGVGLGLTLCREIVTLMGGEIGVVSPPGQGACFWFRAPLARADAVQAA